MCPETLVRNNDEFSVELVNTAHGGANSFAISVSWLWKETQRKVRGSKVDEPPSWLQNDLSIEHRIHCCLHKSQPQTLTKIQ